MELIGKLIWTNPSPGTGFESQAISINISNYSRYKIYYRPTVSNTRLQVAECAFGVGTYLSHAATQSSGQICVMSRSVTIHDNGLEFGKGTIQAAGSSAYTENNNRCVPEFIVGYP